jgi:hypothetical protein
MITLTVTGDSWVEVKAKTQAILNMDVPVQTEEMVHPTFDGIPCRGELVPKSEMDKALAEKRKRHRRTKAEIEAEKATLTQEKADEISEESVEEKSIIDTHALKGSMATLDDCKAALKTIIGPDESGMPKAIHLVKKFGVRSLKDLDPARYGEFLTEAKAVSNG